MGDKADEPTPGQLAELIAGADNPSRQNAGGLRFQWNVPRAVMPDIPLWFALSVLGLLIVVPLLSLLLS